MSLADAVVSVMTKDGQRVIFLMEHKSTHDKGLLELSTDCFSKFNSDFSLAVLKDIEAVAINKPKDRLMNRLKIGREGWLEEGIIKGRQEGREEIALRMLEDGMSIVAICRFLLARGKDTDRRFSRRCYILLLTVPTSRSRSSYQYLGK